ncbi:ribosomal protein S22 [Nesidiocoris tenuis]|uniref:Ribosomal protein S22 n=1 Tax=Nesidiocoris tenuis TaxID=355587 RepID=A0ABN7B622_9HEMI|nr:ribosomal protein S22 [Nesidiocoris tenuis]
MLSSRLCMGLRQLESSFINRQLLTTRRPATCTFASSTDSEKKYLFFENKVQDLLKRLTRKDVNKVFRKRKDGEKVEAAVYKFMTTAQLEEELKKADLKADELLQMPPVVPEREEIDEVLDKDEKLVGLLDTKIIFTDISLDKTDRSRTIAVRDVDGTLRLATWEERSRMNQIYFPRPGREIWVPHVFQDEALQPILERKDYEFILNRACAQFEPDDPDYIRVTTKTYEAVNSFGDFDLLRSTRHFGPLVFHLALTKNLDRLLIENLETDRLEDAAWALQLYNILHADAKINHDYKRGAELEFVKAYIDQCSKDNSQLELAYKHCKDFLSSPKSAAVA